MLDVDVLTTDTPHWSQISTAQVMLSSLIPANAAHNSLLGLIGLTRKPIHMIEVDAIVFPIDQYFFTIHSTGLKSFLRHIGIEFQNTLCASEPLQHGDVRLIPVQHAKCKALILACRIYPHNDTLFSCYQKSLCLAVDHEFTTIAFNLLGTNPFPFKRHTSTNIAAKAVADFIVSNPHTLRNKLIFFGTSTQDLEQMGLYFEQF